MNDTLTPFTAYVDQSLIGRASCFFDNSIEAVIRELLQNSRRAGATRVDLTTQGNKWTYTDNGSGCDPRDLLGLGASRWDESLRERESPAGCGFFALSRRAPTVACPSRGWAVTLCEDHFNGKEVIAPSAIPIESGANQGLAISFVGESTLYSLKDVARYIPVEFYVNGERRASGEDFLAAHPRARASRVFDFNEHIRIRVDIIEGYTSVAEVCYQGLIAHLPDTYKHEFDMRVVPVARIGDSTRLTCSARVLVSREDALPLELPQRNKIISSGVTASLAQRIQFEALDMAASEFADISIECPSRWLKERVNGYTGPVAYPLFIGRQLLRADDNDMSEYVIAADRELGCATYGKWVTIEEFQTVGYLITSFSDTLTLIAQTTIPVVMTAGGSVAYDMDLEDYFAPGMRFVKHLPDIRYLARAKDPDAEGHEWFRNWSFFTAAEDAWCSEAEVVTTRIEDGEVREDRLDIDAGLHGDYVYDTICLEFSSGEEDAEVISLSAAALFSIDGDATDASVDFMATQGWLDGMGSSVVNTIAEAVYEARDCERADSYEQVTQSQIADSIEGRLAGLLGNGESYLSDRLASSLFEVVEPAAWGFQKGLTEIRYTAYVQPDSCRVSRGSCKLELVRLSVPFYTFSGALGEVSCDEVGRREVAGYSNYTEFHSFDVASMKQLGWPAGSCNILDACGWHDSTKRIYVTPCLPHVLWLAGLIPGPEIDVADESVLRGISEALRLDLLSNDLLSALRTEHPEVFSSVLSKQELAALKTVWVFNNSISK